MEYCLVGDNDDVDVDFSGDDIGVNASVLRDAEERQRMKMMNDFII